MGERATKMNWKMVKSRFCRSAYRFPTIQNENPLKSAEPTWRASSAIAETGVSLTRREKLRS